MGGFLFMKKTKPSKNNYIKNDSLRMFLWLQLFSILCYSVMFLSGSFIALMLDIPSTFDYLFSLITFALSNLIVGFYSGIKYRRNGLVNGVLTSLPSNIIILIISLVMCEFAVDINFIITLLVLVVASGVGGILAVNKRTKR